MSKDRNQHNGRNHHNGQQQNHHKTSQQQPATNLSDAEAYEIEIKALAAEVQKLEDSVSRGARVKKTAKIAGANALRAVNAAGYALSGTGGLLAGSIGAAAVIGAPAVPEPTLGQVTALLGAAASTGAAVGVGYHKTVGKRLAQAARNIQEKAAIPALEKAKQLEAQREEALSLQKYGLSFETYLTSVAPCTPQGLKDMEAAHVQRKEEYTQRLQQDTAIRDAVRARQQEALKARQPKTTVGMDPDAQARDQARDALKQSLMAQAANTPDPDDKMSRIRGMQPEQVKER